MSRSQDSVAPNSSAWLDEGWDAGGTGDTDAPAVLGERRRAAVKCSYATRNWWCTRDARPIEGKNVRMSRRTSPSSCRDRRRPRIYDYRAYRDGKETNTRTLWALGRERGGRERERERERENARKKGWQIGARDKFASSREKERKRRARGVTHEAPLSRRESRALLRLDSRGKNRQNPQTQRSNAPLARSSATLSAHRAAHCPSASTFTPLRWVSRSRDFGRARFATERFGAMCDRRCHELSE